MNDIVSLQQSATYTLIFPPSFRSPLPRLQLLRVTTSGILESCFTYRSLARHIRRAVQVSASWDQVIYPKSHVGPGTCDE